MAFLNTKQCSGWYTLVVYIIATVDDQISTWYIAYVHGNKLNYGLWGTSYRANSRWSRQTSLKEKDLSIYFATIYNDRMFFVLS